MSVGFVFWNEGDAANAHAKNPMSVGSARGLALSLLFAPNPADILILYFQRPRRTANNNKSSHLFYFPRLPATSRDFPRLPITVGINIA
ncbi:MAG: hypothetical protein HY046_03105 [Acidobacteria bacterium]|nr:hypothetical protein [Acidobacteriota bacterium]